MPDRVPATLNLPSFPHTRRELPTLRLVEAGLQGDAPTLIVSPYSIHDAGIADLAPGHSLARVLLDEGVAPLALVSWRTASHEMRDFGVDDYLSDLDVAVDEFGVASDALGGRVALVGLCQGGWLAALYAARFPHKVAGLVLVGAPLAPGACASVITCTLALTPPALVEGFVALSGGRVFGAPVGLDREFDAKRALQCRPDAALMAIFEAWRARNLALPGRFFLETTEWLFRQNRLAENRFPALGQSCGLADVTAPVYVLAARDDLIVPPAQATAITGEIVLAEGGHLSLFMGRCTLKTHWPKIARWLKAAWTQRAAAR